MSTYSDSPEYFFAECNHEDYVKYEPLDNSSGYFKPKYLEGQKNWPHICAKCSKQLLDIPNSKIDKETQYKVSSRNIVHLCPNARDTRHPCVHALCDPCMKEKKVDCVFSPTRTRVATPKAAKTDNAANAVEAD